MEEHQPAQGPWASWYSNPTMEASEASSKLGVKKPKMALVRELLRHGEGWLACKGTPPCTGPCNPALFTLVLETSGKGVMEERGEEEQITLKRGAGSCCLPGTPAGWLDRQLGLSMVSKAAKAAGRGDRASIQANAWRQDMEDTHGSHPWTPAWDWGWMMDDGGMGKACWHPSLPREPCSGISVWNKRGMPRRTRKRPRKLDMIRFAL